jgi:hypothetical protein
MKWSRVQDPLKNDPSKYDYFKLRSEVRGIQGADFNPRAFQRELAQHRKYTPKGAAYFTPGFARKYKIKVRRTFGKGESATRPM